MTVGKKIKEERQRQKLTQKQLGALCRPPMQEAAVRQYENGKRNPKRENLERLARALQVPVSALLPELPDYTENIPRLRAEHGLSVEQLATAAGLSVEQVQALESGENVSGRALSQVAKALHVEISTLMNFPERWQARLNDSENCLIGDYRSLNSGGQAEASRRVHELTQLPQYQKEAKHHAKT